MGDHVEARSLASLNYLAANPPQYPKKPTEETQQPLILYISRVPGTRDIILSTLKPQLKNVTAEDVTNSLYYVHLDTPEDEAFITPPNQIDLPSSPRTSGESSRSQIHRKPVPGAASIASSRIDESAPPPPFGKENQGNPAVRRTQSVSRKPVPQPPLFHNLPPSQFIPPTGPSQRRPLGPIPTITQDTSNNQPPPPAYQQFPDHQFGPTHEQRPPLPARPGTKPPVQQPPDSHAPSFGEGRPPSPKSWTNRRPFMPFSLTLIRRDPSSGQQWNVGKVASFQLENPELIADDRRYQPSPSIIIHLETSGYAKFRGMPTQAPADIRASLDIRPGSASSRPQPPETHALVNGSYAFERHVMMSYSKSFATNLREKFHHSRSPSDEERSTSPSFLAHQHDRHGSMGSIGSFGGDFDGGEAPMLTQPAPGLKPRGYVFYSPWGGRCEFVTGNAGRSLNCRHVLPTYGGPVFNPLVDGPEAAHSSHKPKALPISELRFNLPNNELFNEKKGHEGPVRTRDQVQSHINKVIQKAQGLDADDDPDWHLDLTLGKEKAGGGNRGKRAKMGKLIVFEDGLKMLDLVIAANVGIWWTAWERTY